MPIQPLEVYEVEETGELVLKHKNLKEALVSHNVIMIVNHNDKSVVIWIGKGASTRAKFAAARASRRFLTERSLSYRVKTCDEGEEPEWFQKLFELKVAKRTRDEPPSLEVLAILNEMKAEPIPDGFEREACIISRDFYVPVEHKSSIMGKDTSTIKFEKSSYLPEGFFTLPSEAYRPRLLVRNGKVLATDFLVSHNIMKMEQQIEELQQKVKEKKSEIEALQQDGKEKDKKIENLQQILAEKEQEISKMKSEIDALQQAVKEKDQEITSLQQDNSNKDQEIKMLQQENAKKEAEIEDLQQNISEKSQKIETIQQELNEKKSRVETLEEEGAKKDLQIEELQQQNTTKEKQISSLQQEINEIKSQMETLQQQNVEKDQQIADLQQDISKKEKAIEEQTSLLDKRNKELEEKERIIQQKEEEIAKQKEIFQKKETELKNKIQELEAIQESEAPD
ncbi:MAG: hypothetical protein ACTSYB_09005 [Candidatus Helarchaeota archaeon]